MAHGVVIIGASIAGVHTMKELRKKGYEGPITLIDEQSELPYDLLPLSKEWMLNEDKTDPPYLVKEAYYDEHTIHLRLKTKVIGFDPEKKTVQTAQQEEIAYDQLVIAIGSVLRTLSIPNSEADGIFHLRNFEDAYKIKKWGQSVKDLVVIGGGFIGLEIASTFVQTGHHVTVLSRADYPLGKIIGQEASEYFMNMHQSHGVTFITGETAAEFQTDEDGKVQAIVTNQGKTLPCQMVVIGIGVVPNTTITHPSLHVDGGIVVNEFGETSIPHVYAAGDCTVWPYNGQPIHIEHWEHAYHHGRTVARNMIEEKSEPYTRRPYFWTDEYDETFEYLGHAVKWHKTIVRGSLDTPHFTIAYVDEQNIPLAILFANTGDKRQEVTHFMNQNKAIDENKFKDLSIPLDAL